MGSTNTGDFDDDAGIEVHKIQTRWVASSHNHNT